MYDIIIENVVRYIGQLFYGVINLKYSELSKTCCFFGHRKIYKSDELVKRVTGVIESLIKNNEVDTFLFGSKSEFDDLCLKLVTEFKNKNPHIRRIYVRAEYPYIDERYRKQLLNQYDDTYYPDKLINSGRAVYVERNYEMIDKSYYCVIYYDKAYLPPQRKNSKRDLFNYQPKSGTGIAYNYAVLNGREIINVL